MNTNAFIPAFPTWVKDDAMMPGMNLRDYFAAQAMQAFISTRTHPGIDAEETSVKAYFVADAMLKARQK